MTDDRLSREAIVWRTLAIAPSGLWVLLGVTTAWTPDVDPDILLLSAMCAAGSAPVFFDGVSGMLLGVLLLRARALGGQAAVDSLRAAWRKS